MRLAFFILVLLNLGFYVFSAGYLGGPPAGHEPERLRQQIEPEKVRVIGPVAPGAIACKLLSGLSMAEAKVVEESLRGGSEVSVAVRPVEEPPSWWVLIPELANKDAAEKKLAEARKLGAKDSKSVADEKSGPFIVSLGVFSTEAAASEQLDSLTKKGVRSARVEERRPPPQKAQVEIRAGAALLDALPKALAAYPAASLVDCAGK